MPSIPSESLNLNSGETVSLMDIKNFLNKENLNNLKRLEIIEKLWIPDDSFNFP